MGASFAKDLQYPDQPPFEDLYRTHLLLFRATNGEAADSAIEYFREQADSVSTEYYGSSAIEAYLILLDRIGQHEQALEEYARLVPVESSLSAHSPSLLQLAERSGCWDRYFEICEQREDAVGYAAGLLSRPQILSRALIPCRPRSLSCCRWIPRQEVLRDGNYPRNVDVAGGPRDPQAGVDHGRAAVQTRPEGQTQAAVRRAVAADRPVLPRKIDAVRDRHEAMDPGGRANVRHPLWGDALVLLAVDHHWNLGAGRCVEGGPSQLGPRRLPCSIITNC